MLYGLIAACGLAGLFLFLFIRSAINNGQIKRENTELKKNADIARKQLEIAANHPDTPSSLAERMHNGTL